MASPAARCAPPRRAPGLRLFVLGSGGVLFAADRQEIHALDAPGTLLWLGLESGAGPAELARLLAERSGCGARLALRRVEGALRAWTRRGWIRTGGAGEGRTDPPRPLRRPAAGRSPRPHSAPRTARGRVYRAHLLSTRFDLVVEGAAARARLLPALRHLERSRRGAGDVLVEVRRTGSRHAVVVDGVAVGSQIATDAIAPVVKLQLRLIAMDRHAYFMQIHAGAVLGSTGCWLLPGAPGRGKTTLTAALVRGGLAYLSDEVALLEPRTLGVRPVPLAFTVKPGAVESLVPLYPGLSKLAVHQREDGRRVRYLPPPAGSIAPDRPGGHPVAGLLFPRFEPGSAISLDPLDPLEALRRLLESCLSLPEALTTARVERLVRWMRGLAAFEVRMGPLEEAVSALGALLGARR